MRRARAAVGWLVHRLTVPAVALGPSLALVAFFLWPALSDRVNQILELIRPVAVEQAQLAMARPVKIERLTPDLNLPTLWTLLRDPKRGSRFPITAENVEIGCRPEEIASHGQSWVFRARTIRATVSVPEALAGRFSEAGLQQVAVIGFDGVIVRNADGTVNLQTLVPKSPLPPDPTKPVFETQITATAGRLRFRDFATKRSRLEENYLAEIDGNATLGTRLVRFAVTAKAAPNTATARRLGGKITASGTAMRGKPGEHPNGPTAALPRLLLTVRVPDADLAYWQPYAVALKDLTLQTGRASVAATVYVRSDESLIKPHPIVQASTTFRAASLRLTKAPWATLDGFSGRASYDDGRLELATTGKALGERISADATLLVADQPEATQLDARIAMPRIPIARVLAALPEVKLPPDLTLGPTLSLTGATVHGTLQNPRVHALISDGSATWRGLPTLREIAAEVRYQDKSLIADRLLAKIDGGGQLTASGMFDPTQNSGTVAGRLDTLDLARIEPIRKSLPPALRLTGRVSASFAGSIRGKVPTASVVVRGDRIALGKLPFPVTNAQLTLNDKTVTIARAEAAGPLGVLRLSGGGTLGGALSVTATAVGWELSPLSAAFGVQGVAGTLSASVRLTGTQQKPSLLLTNLAVLNPRLSQGGQLFAADVLSCDRLTLSLANKDRLSVPIDPAHPIVLARYPAIATLSGTISGKLSDPALMLAARIENVDLAEAWRQSQPRSSMAPELPQLAVLGWETAQTLPFGGNLTEASATITGSSKNPRVQGSVRLGASAAAGFALSGGTAEFTYADREITVPKLVLTSAGGTISGSATMTADGKLQGTLQTDGAFNLDALTYLVGDKIPLAGMISISAALSGSRTHPELVVRLAPKSNVTLAGIDLIAQTEATLAANVTVAPDATLRGEATLKDVIFAQGKTELALSEAHFDLETHALRAALSAHTEIPSLLELLRGSRLDDIAALKAPPGEPERSVLASLASLPEGLGGSVALGVEFSGRVAENTLIDRKGKVTIRGENLHIDSPIQGTLQATAELEGNRLFFRNPTQLAMVDPKQPDDTAILRIQPLGPNDPSWLDFPEVAKQPVGLHLALDSNEIPLAVLHAFAPSLSALTGSATVTLRAKGTTEQPQITASLYADELRYQSVVTASSATAPPPFGFQVDIPQVSIVTNERGNPIVSVENGRLQHGSETITLAGQLPLTTTRGPVHISSNRPLDFAVATTGIQLKTITDALGVGDVKSTGVIKGNLALGGSLAMPQLRGELSVTGGTLAFPTKIKRRPVKDLVEAPLRVNAISQLNLVARFAADGKTLQFPQARLQLSAGPEVGDKRSGGSLSLSPDSTITLENLEDFTRLFGRSGADMSEPKVRGKFNVTAVFDRFTLDSENLTALFGLSDVKNRPGLGEKITSRLDGTIRIEDELLRPTIRTRPGQPIQLSEAKFQLFAGQMVESEKKAATVFDPRLAIQIEAPKDVLLKSPPAQFPSYDFLGTGNFAIVGSASAPDVRGTIDVGGGNFNYPFAPFRVKRGGTILVEYKAQGFAVRLDDVVAESRVNAPSSSISNARKNRGLFDAGIGGKGSLANLTPGERITISATFKGPLYFGDPNLSRSGNLAIPVRFESNPSLAESDIYRLLTLQDQLAGIAGDPKAAFQESLDLASQGFLSQIVGRAADPLRNLLGADALTLDTTADGNANVSLQYRFKPPLDRVTLEMRRAFQTRSGVTSKLPQYYSVNYELFQLKRFGAQPRFTLTLSTNEQRDTAGSLRGTIKY